MNNCDDCDDKIRVNIIPGLTMLQFKIMRAAFWFIVLCLAIMIITPVVLFSYPFKAVTFVIPVRILNNGKIVACHTDIQMEINYKKFVNSPGLTIMTLGYKENDLFHPLDSTTMVSNLPRGNGKVNLSYTLPANPNLIGKDRVIRFSIYHWLLGFRPILEQFDSEIFTIYCPPKPSP